MAQHKAGRRKNGNSYALVLLSTLTLQPGSVHLPWQSPGRDQRIEALSSMLTGKAFLKRYLPASHLIMYRLRRRTIVEARSQSNTLS